MGLKKPWDAIRVEDVVGLVGVAALTVGAGLIYLPAAFIVLGVLLVAAAFVWASS